MLACVKAGHCQFTSSRYQCLAPIYLYILDISCQCWALDRTGVSARQCIFNINMLVLMPGTVSKSCHIQMLFRGISGKICWVIYWMFWLICYLQLPLVVGLMVWQPYMFACRVKTKEACLVTVFLPFIFIHTLIMLPLTRGFSSKYRSNL